MLMAALVASIITPLLFLITYGYFGYQARVSDSSEVIDRLARVAEEQALKLLEVNQEMSLRVMSVLGGDGDGQIRARQQPLHRFLQETVQRLPSIASIAIFGRKGELLVSSNTYPVGILSIGDHPEFRSAQTRDAVATAISLPERIPEMGLDVFNTSTPRYDANGRFLGVIYISLRRDAFLSFYEQLTSHDRALTLGLFRKDAAILARSPAPKARRAPTTNQPLLDAIRVGNRDGRIRINSTLDGEEKLLAYRKVGAYPLYVTAGIPVSVVTYRWIIHDGLIAIATLLPCLGIWMLVLFSLRRLKEERIAWERWRAEFGMRLSAESTGRRMKRMSALGNLVANVAHDFNNLLMVVKANMELARRKGFNGLEKEVMAVERASAGAEVLARRLLSVARKQPLRQEEVRLEQWLEEDAALIRTSLGDRIRLSVSSFEKIWPIHVDASELQSALINLAVNAKDAMPDGGEFVIRGENIEVLQASGSLKSGEYVVISCSDTGVGMPASVAQRAFEPLFTTKSASAGTGLGLAQVFATCEQAGGTAKIESVVGAGTTILLYFPRRVEQAEIETRSDAPAPVLTEVPGKGSILLVEDNDEVAAGLAAVLEVFGWKAQHELTGDAALRLLDDGKTFDLILSDIQMPGVNNGIDVAEKVRRRWPKQAIALMTGYADEFERAKKSGVTILSKPFNVDDLQALLQSVQVSA